MDKRFTALWAKSTKDEHSGHPVVAHLLDVAASTHAILQLEPESTQDLYADDFELPRAEALAWVRALTGLHDIGKVSPAFQQKWGRGFERLVRVEPRFDWHNDERLAAPTKPPNDVSHSLISQVVLPDLLKRREFPRPLANSIADAVGCHHGFRAVSLEPVTKRERGVGIWDEAREAVLDAVLETLGVGVAPKAPKLRPAAFMRLAGLTSFADWIGSSFYPELTFDGFEGDLPGYYQEARRLAEKRVRDLGWTRREPLTKEPLPLEQVFAYLVRKSGKSFVPRTLQTEVKGLLENVSQPALLLIEAAMGEGKTEAAFYAHLRLQAELGHRGLYVALPTMATGNMMFERTALFLNEQAKGREVPVDLQLLHGATRLNRHYQILQGKLRPNVEDDVLEYVQAREYFTHKKQALLSEYGVGTVDQVLLTVLNIKWHFVRLWGLGNRVVVIDEVHAYDTYTSSLIVTLVRWLYALGSSVILMSATLPKTKRQELLEAFGGVNKASKCYPRIFKVSGGQTELVEFEGDQSRQITVGLEAISNDPSDIVRLLEQKLANGGCAVCIVNTVDRAQELYGKLAQFERYLFHARFPAEDRARLETLVTTKFGKDATRANGKRPQRAVLIATQVVEQSLDLDFDLMVSDLAPVDLLLQRAGRLWRHQRDSSDRPIARPVLYVAGMQHDDELPDLAAHYWDKVYSPYILYKTWEALRCRSTIDVPDDIDPLVQQVYDGNEVALELSPAARSRIQDDEAQFKQEQLIDRKDGNHAVISHVSKRGELQLRDAIAFREEDDKPSGKPVALTRKGEASVTVVPLYRLQERYFLDAEGHKPYDPGKPVETFMRSVRLSRVGIVGSAHPKRYVPSALEHHNEQNGIAKDFAHWEKDALLRSCVPLVLAVEGRLHLGRTSVELDSELGVVYRAKK